MSKIHNYVCTLLHITPVRVNAQKIVIKDN